MVALLVVVNMQHFLITWFAGLIILLHPKLIQSIVFSREMLKKAWPNLHMFAHVSTCQHMLPKNHFRGYRVPKKGCLSGVSAAEMGLSPTNDLKMDF